MIRKNVLNFKLFLPFFTADSELDGFRASVKAHEEHCPSCGAKGKGRIFASYERHIIDIADGKPLIRRIKVPRYLCKCGHSHAFLPDFIIPYSQYTLPFILYVLKLYFSRSMTIQAICDSYQITPRTLYRWKRVFTEHRELWPAFARFRHKSGEQVIDFLLSRPVFSDFTASFYSETLLSFLQTHANPANCCHPPPGRGSVIPPCTRHDNTNLLRGAL